MGSCIIFLYYFNRPEVMKYKQQPAEIIHMYFYLNTAWPATENGLKLNQLTFTIQYMTFHSLRMLDGPITFWPWHRKIYIFIVYAHQSKFIPFFTYHLVLIVMLIKLIANHRAYLGLMFSFFRSLPIIVAQFGVYLGI